MDVIADETLVWQGSAVKALGDGKVAGYLVRFSTDNDPDLENEFFTKSTDFGIEDGDKTAILWHHALDPQIGNRRLGKGTLKTDDVGVWVEAQLELRDEYEQKIYQLARDGKLGWSSGTAGHLMKKEKVGKSTWIKSWSLGLDASLTPTPAEPRAHAVPLKSLSSCPTGKTLSDHTGEVLDTLTDYLTRIQGYAQMKAAEEKVVPAERRTQFMELKSKLDALILVTTPKPTKSIELQKQLLKLKADVISLSRANPTSTGAVV